MANEKKSIIKEAVADLKEIHKAAEKVAKDNLSAEFPDKFQKLLKEELDKDKNKEKSEKESYKKVDDKKESDENEDESDDKKEKSTMKKDKKEAKKVVKEERDTDFMGDVESGTPNINTPLPEDGDTFTDKITTKQDTLANDTTIKEEFDLSELDLPDVENNLDGAAPEDEIITLDQIEQEIQEMENLETGLNEDENEPFNQLVSMKNKITEMLDDMNEQKKKGGQLRVGKDGQHKAGGPDTGMIEEEEVAEQKKHGGKLRVGKDGDHKAGGPDTGMIEEETEFDSAEIDDAIDEAQGGSLSSNKHAAGDHLPGKGYSDYKNDKKRIGSVNRQNESVQKRIDGLVQENKKLTKKIVESKKYKETVTTLVESYKTALDKYRTQLQTMSVYNTNLANVNNVLVNEELALTHADKVKLIKEFKEIDTIKGSQEKYKAVLAEMKEGKQTISENVEEVITESVGASSKKQLDEVDVKTAYKNDKQIGRMKELIESMEKKDKKII